MITKPTGSGGTVSLQSCKEQLLYELHDPARYYQPDVVADFSAVRLDPDGADRVRVTGGTGAPRTGTLKVSIGYRDSFVGEGQISYAGAGALARGKLALEIVRERLRLTGVATTELRCDLIGVDALHRGPVPAPEPAEVRLRVIGRTDSLAEAVRIGNEVETLYTNGPGRRRRGVEIRPRGAGRGVHPGPGDRRHPLRVLSGGVMRLRALAHARTGDKGDISSISVIAYDPGDFAFLAEHVTAARVAAHFAGTVRGKVERYELPGLGALNFVLHAALGGGVTRSLALDAHGKSLSSSLLEMDLPDPQTPATP